MSAGWKSSSHEWVLSAPESYVLAQGGGASGSEAFKLALKEAVARGMVSLERPSGRKGLLGIGKPKPILVDWRPAKAAGNPVLAELTSLWEGCRAQVLPDNRLAVPLADFAKAATRRYGSLGQFTGRVVMPALVSRGLFQKENRKVLWVFNAPVHRLTESGEALRRQLDDLLNVDLKRVPSLAGSDPRQAAAIVGLAGMSILLAPEIIPSLRDLRRRPADEGDYVDTTGGVWVGDSDRRGTEPVDSDSDFGVDVGAAATTDLSAFDFSAIDFDALDSMDDFSADIDSGVSDAGGDSGGSDGGGGDGGGGD
jgi:hypothetical protein